MGDATQEPKPAYVQRLLTSIIDERASSNPQKTFMSIPAGNKVADGQRDISYGDVARAINRCAWWIESTLGKGVDFPPIATYLSPMDFRHVILIFGAVKSGYKVWRLDMAQVMACSSAHTHVDVLQLSTEPLRCPGRAVGETSMHSPLHTREDVGGHTGCTPEAGYEEVYSA